MNQSVQIREWYLPKEVAGLPGMPTSDRAIRNRARAGNLVFRRRLTGKGIEIHHSCLPESALIVLHKDKSTPVSTKDEHLTATSNEEYDPEVLWSNYEQKTFKQKAEAERKLKLLVQVMDMKELGAKNGDAFCVVAERNGESARTLQGWFYRVRKYARADWLAGLVAKDSGCTVEAKITEEAWTAWLSLYLRLEQPTATDCYRDLRAIATTKSWDTLPSLKTFLRQTKKNIPRTVITLKRKGEAALMQTYPCQQRSVKDIHALQWINGDGYMHNVWVELPTKEVVRLKTWFWQDIHSRKILTFRTDLTENTDMIRSSFGDLVERFGIPEDVTIDNTRAAANKFMTGGIANRYRFKVKEDDPLGLFTLLGIKVHWTTVHNGRGHGQAKPIERSFGVGGLGEWVDKAPQFAGAYTGPDPMNKPENCRERAVPLAQFLAVLNQRIASWNAREGRRTEMCAGELSFDQCFERSYAVSPIQKATKAQRLLWMLLAESITVQKDGSFTLNAGSATGVGRNRYACNDLRNYVGQKIVVRFDPQALHDSVYAYTLDGKEIGEAECIEATAFGDTETSRAFNRARRQSFKADKDLAKALVTMDTLDAAGMIPEPDDLPSVENKVSRTMPAINLGASKPKAAPQQSLTNEQKETLASTLVQINTELNELKNAPEEIDRDHPMACINLYGKLMDMAGQDKQLTSMQKDFCVWFEEDSGYTRTYDVVKEDMDFSAIGLPRGWE